MARKTVVKVASHLRKYLLLYVVLAALVGLAVGYQGAGFFKTHKAEMKYVILGAAIATLYPSMIQLRAGKMGSEFREKFWEAVAGLVLIFVAAPLLAITLAGFIPHREVGIGFVAANAVPASSASIAYVMLAEGNIEFATLLAILSIAGALVAAPTYVGLYARSVSVSVPVKDLAVSVLVALLTPFILGQLTRYYLVKRRARAMLVSDDVELECKKALAGRVKSIRDAVEEIEDVLECIEGRIGKALKPYLSLATMVSMLTLISLLVANKAHLLVEKPSIAAWIVGSQLVIYGVMIPLVILASKLMKMSYEDHMALAFITITKNQSVAAAMAVMAIGTTAALPAALIPAIQPIVAIAYIAAAPVLRRIFPGTTRFTGKGKGK